jgi:hypothetical protein
MPIIRSTIVSSAFWCPNLESRLGCVAQHTHLTAQCYTTQTAFQVWTPKSGTHDCTPDEGHTCARNMLSLYTNIFVASSWSLFYIITPSYLQGPPHFDGVLKHLILTLFWIMLHSGYIGMEEACDLISPVMCALKINLQSQVSFTCILTYCMMFCEPRQIHMYYHNFSCSVPPYPTDERHFEFLQTLCIAD